MIYETVVRATPPADLAALLERLYELANHDQADAIVELLEAHHFHDPGDGAAAELAPAAAVDPVRVGDPVTVTPLRSLTLTLLDQKLAGAEIANLGRGSDGRDQFMDQIGSALGRAIATAADQILTDPAPHRP